MDITRHSARHNNMLWRHYKFPFIFMALSVIAGSIIWFAFAPEKIERVAVIEERANFETATHNIEGEHPSPYYGTLTERLLGANEQSGIILYTNGVKAVDSYQGLGGTQRISQAYAMIPDYLLSEQPIHYELSVTIEEMIDTRTVYDALRSLREERVKWAADYIINNMTPQEALPYTQLLLLTAVDDERRYDINVNKALHHIGSLAFQYYTNVLGQTNAKQSKLIGDIIGNAEQKYPELITILLSRYPDNEAFMLGISPSFMFGKSYNVDKALPILEQMQASRSPKVRQHVMTAIGNMETVNEMVMTMIIRGLYDNEMSIHTNLLKSIQRLMPHFDKPQKDQIADLIKQRLDQMAGSETLNASASKLQASYKRTMQLL